MGRTHRQPRNDNPSVVVEPLPEDWDSERLQNFFQEANVGVKSVVKDVKHSRWGIVTFASAKDVKAADAVFEKEAPNAQGQRKRRRSYRRPPRPNVDPASIDIADVVCPLRALPYAQQLRLKQDKVVEALQQMSRKVAGRVVGVADEQGAQGWWEREDGMACELLGIVRSPLLNGYRNKCEFTLGNDVHDQPTVGFLLGSYRDGLTQVAEPKGCIHTPAATRQVAAWTQEYLREQSELPVWDKRTNAGFWRLLVVREGRERTFLPLPGRSQALQQAPHPTFSSLDWKQWLVDTGAEREEGGPAGLHISDIDALTEHDAPTCDEMLVMLQVNPKYTSEEKMAAECSALGRLLAKRAAECEPPLPIKALLLQHHDGLGNAAQPDAEVLPLISPSAEPQGEASYHQEFIHDALCDLTFRVSSGAFFQVNTGAAALLYALAGEWAAPRAGALLLDVCCGTGTIGMTLAHRVREVVGIELVEQAVLDARQNACMNGIHNCTFVCGKAEDVMKVLLDKCAALLATAGGVDGAGNGAAGPVPSSSAKLPDTDGGAVAGSNGSTPPVAATLTAEDSSTIQPPSKRARVELQPDLDSVADAVLPAVGVAVAQQAGGAGGEAASAKPAQNSAASLTLPAEDPDTAVAGQPGGGKEAAAVAPAAVGKTAAAGHKAAPAAGAPGSGAREEWVTKFTDFSEVVAIVDPPRAGLHPKVLKALLRCRPLKRLVYVSCNPETLAANVAELCTPQEGFNAPVPFRPVKAVAVDLFPHTKHCEAVMLLQRD